MCSASTACKAARRGAPELLPMKITGKWIASIVLAAAALVSCESESKITIRELPPEDQQLRLVATDVERFRYKAQETSNDHSHQHSHGTGSEGSPTLVHETPEGWTESEAPMRDLNFTFGENGEGECYLTRLPGAGGGLAPNVNRWRQQMGAEALTEEEVDALPKKTLFGQPATYVTVEGDFSGMSGDKKENYRLLGLILSSPAGAIFVKMTGPKDLVDKNEVAFEQFTDSLGISTE